MDGTESDEDFSLGPGGEREADEAALRAALHFHVGEICSSETTGKPMTGAAVSTLAESLPLSLPSLKVLRDITVPSTSEKIDEVTPRSLVCLIRPFARHGDKMTHKTTGMSKVVFKYTEAMALDLRVFARHAKRAVVGVDDVKCLARKDPKLVEKLVAFEAANLNVGKKKTTRRKKKLPEEGAVGVPSVNEDRGDDSTCRRNATLNRDLTTSEGRQPREGSKPGDFVDLLETDDSEFGGGGASGMQSLTRREGGDSDGDSDDLLI